MNFDELEYIPDFDELEYDYLQERVEFGLISWVESLLRNSVFDEVQRINLEMNIVTNEDGYNAIRILKENQLEPTITGRGSEKEYAKSVRKIIARDEN